MSDPTNDSASGSTPEQPQLAQRRRMSPGMWVVLVLSLLYVAGRVRDDLRGEPDVWSPGQREIRDTLFEISDLMREQQRRGSGVREAFEAVTVDVISRRHMGSYSFYLTPEIAVHGPSSAMPREGLPLWGEGVPSPQFDAESWTYLIVAARPTGQAKHVDVWTINSSREVTRGRYWLAE